ncbi:hypothetical protein LOTGIDRAFT_159161 [Lottia gigantea]|uniref:WD repeat-containing protein 89 n=1 Tax=Lottia gigantea TaxID=225164 RepID=V4AXQ2_LOTGI|nr:hypothetical protein LOTGIDRAFT_159161 [Lottia gigantea]ESO98356.1 hypothetical protein LOTGIDRAFT_159161 [Lottia gigantea]
MESLTSQLNNLQLAQKSAISLAKTEPEYILTLAAQENRCEDSESLLAATSSNFTIRLYNKTTLASSSNIQAHDTVITGITFGNEDPNILISSSSDKTVKCWDLRSSPENAAQTFQGGCNTGFGSVDINSDDRLICAGTEVDKNKDVFMIFWDRRKSSYLGSYTESFENEITQVKFHPSKSDCIASGASDGLVNIFNLKETDEDDALQLTLNTESFVARIGWCGEDYSNIYCITDVDTYHVWDATEGDVIKEVLNLKDKLKGEESIDYMIDVVPTLDTSKHFLATGTKSGDIKLLDVTSKIPDMISCLSKGHNEIVRCIYYNVQNRTLVTGGEDSLLCLWSSENITPNTNSSKRGVKMKQTPTKRLKPYKR